MEHAMRHSTLVELADELFRIYDAEEATSPRRTAPRLGEVGPGAD
jgi:hypothetical protein